jgi:membrane protease YdiL (CAAX protease family)
VKNSNKPTHSLSPGKTIGFALAGIFIFIVVAVICNLSTFWIPSIAIRVVIREVLLRLPLTIWALHIFAVKVIRAYDPGVIYGKISLLKTLKWIAISFILPVTVWLFYYLFHFAVPFVHTIPLSSTEQLDILIRWLAVSIAAGLTEEVLFRGHFFMIINNRYSKVKAIFVTSLIFGIVHIAMLSSFSATDIVIVVFGGIISGIMFSCIYQYTKVIWYAGIVHVVWDIFFIGKITALASSGAEANKIIMAFKLTTKSLLFTGGNFGIEASLPSLTVYLLVTIILGLGFASRGTFNDFTKQTPA